MDESAIRLIQQTAIGDYNGKQERLNGTHTIALPSNFHLHDLEMYREHRRRFRGDMATSVLADFIAFTKNNVAPDQPTVGFIDARTMGATVFFNLGTKELPGHGDHTATLSLEKTAAYAALLAINGKPLGQQTLIDWLEDWQDNVRVGGFGGPLSSAIAAIRKITIAKKTEAESSVENFKATGSVLDEVEAKSSLGLPEKFVFTAEPYLGLAPREFVLQLRVLTGNAERAPSLVLRINQLEQAQEDIAQEFKAVLFRELDGAASLYIGGFKVGA